MSEVYVVAWRKLDDAATADRPVAWLVAVARGVLANQRRSLARGARLIERLTITGRWASIDPADIVTGNAGVEEVYALLASLPALDQELITMACLEGLSYDEIGAALKREPSVVRTRLYRARQQLNKGLAASRAREDQPKPDTNQNEGGKEGGQSPESQGGVR